MLNLHWIYQWILTDMTLKCMSNTRKTKLDIIKTKNFCKSKDIINTVKDHLQNGRKYLQIMYLIKV